MPLKETQFTATGPASIGFQTEPPETSAEFGVGVDASGLEIGVKGTGTQGEQAPSKPNVGGTGVQGNGTGVGWGVAGFGGNATLGTGPVAPSACAGVFGVGGSQTAGVVPIVGAPGVAGIGGPNSGIGVYGQGSGPGEQGGPGGPGIKGVGGANTPTDDADGVQGYGSGGFSGVAGFGGEISGSGVFGYGGGPSGPGVRGIGSGGAITAPSAPVGVYGQGGPNADGVQGIGTVGVHGIAGGNAGDIGVYAEAGASGYAFYGVSGGAGEGGVAAFFDGDVEVAAGGNLITGRISGPGDLLVSCDNFMLDGNFSVVGGTKSAVVPLPDGSHRQLYCLESPESWFEDFGFGRLTDGRAQIELDPDFAATANTRSYHVFITEYDDNNGLFVTDRSNTGFEVRAKTSVGEATFSYRVVAQRKDIAPARLARVLVPTVSRQVVRRHRPVRGRAQQPMDSKQDLREPGPEPGPVSPKF